MSLLGKLGKLIGRSGDPEREVMKELAALDKDGRLHARYIVSGDSVATLHLDNGMTGSIKNVSYGGLAVRLSPESSKLPLPAGSPVGGRIQILDRSINCTLTPVRQVGQPGETATFIGFSLRHDGADTLIFMRDLIEPLRCGQSLVPIEQAMRNDRFKDPEWTCLRGEGPTDLIIRRTKDGSDIKEALLTFRIADSYCELSYKDEVLKTGKAFGRSDAFSIGGQMASTADVDLNVLRQGVCILLGTPPTCRKLIVPLLIEALRPLSISYVESAA